MSVLAGLCVKFAHRVNARWISHTGTHTNTASSTLKDARAEQTSMRMIGRSNDV